LGSFGVGDGSSHGSEPVVFCASCGVRWGSAMGSFGASFFGRELAAEALEAVKIVAGPAVETPVHAQTLAVFPRPGWPSTFVVTHPP
jgi:hypothetical protein